MAWSRGEVIVRREIVLGKPWLVVPVFVVEDTDELLVTYLPEGAPFGFLPGDWPTADGLHPWDSAGKRAWAGHGALMLQRPDESHAVWHFWVGPERTFTTWYINLQEPFRRTAAGFDTQDLEVDLVVAADGSWMFKDWDLLEQRVNEGRFTPAEAEAIRADALQIGDDLRNGRLWWSEAWTRWQPDPDWLGPVLPPGWDTPEGTSEAAQRPPP